MTSSTLQHPDDNPPRAFTQEVLDWLPWLEPLAESELAEREFAGVVALPAPGR
jgi:hypothetical protein